MEFIWWHCLVKRKDTVNVRVSVVGPDTSTRPEQDLTFSVPTNRAWICLFCYLFNFLHAHTNRGMMDEQKVIENGVVLFCVPETTAKLKNWRERGKDSRSSSRKWGWWGAVTVVGRGGKDALKMRQANNEDTQLFSVNLFLSIHTVFHLPENYTFLVQSPHYW